jgi:hypothetical protein
MSNGPLSTGSARRRNAALALTELPAEGRTGPTPDWPLGPDLMLWSMREVAQSRLDQLEFDRDEGKAVDDDKIDRVRAEVLRLDTMLARQGEAEAELWAALWATPQAVQWERLRWTRTVATYVRWQVRGEGGDLKAAQEARHLNDRLGLNPVAMQRLRWTVVADELAERKTAKASAATARKRVRAVKAVDTSASS